MPYTMQNAVDRARQPLNDEDTVPRIPEAELLNYANDFLNRTKARRPDIFFGQYLTLPNELVIGAVFPIDDMFFPAAVDYIVARGHGKDDEAAYREVVSMYMGLSESVAG